MVKDKNEIYGALTIPLSQRYLQKPREWACGRFDEKLRFHNFFKREGVKMLSKAKAKKKYKLLSQMEQESLTENKQFEDYKRWFKNSAVIIKQDGRRTYVASMMEKRWKWHLLDHVWDEETFYINARVFYRDTRATVFLPHFYQQIQSEFRDRVQASPIDDFLALPRDTVRDIAITYYRQFGIQPLIVIVTKKGGKDEALQRKKKNDEYIWHEVRFKYDKKDMSPVESSSYETGLDWLICDHKNKVKLIHFPALRLRKVFEKEKKGGDDEDDDNEEGGDDEDEDIEERGDDSKDSKVRDYKVGNVASMSGGIVVQEVVKPYSGKFHSLHQCDLRPLNTWRDAQISVFGAKLQKKMEDAKAFMVGSGALGCEFLKNLALLGVSCGKKGKLTDTDDNVIEKSNLSRQFLFCDWNIGQGKSTVAASAALSIKHVEYLLNRVGPETENVFDDTFWENLTTVVNALDNVNARLYVDHRCLYYQKPLLESGNTQMVIPHLSENYGASRDPPEKQAPMCTVHSFPHNIDHCLTWARSEFEGLLEKTPAEVNAYLSNPGEYTKAMTNAVDAQARDNLEHVLECLNKEKCETFQDCVTWARLRFEDYFANRVKQLAFTFPEDAATSTGASFWSAPNRFPHPLQFSDDDSSHLHFIMAGSVLRAETFGIPIPDWVQNPKKKAEAVNRVIVPDFEPRKDVKIVTDENSASIDDVAVINELIAKLEHFWESLSPGYRMKPIQFEKDDNTNYHMDMIAALANTRARNYAIPEVDKLKAKFIAGRIILAIATATALATGLVYLDLYKVLAGGHKVEDYSNTYATLALPFFSMPEPVPPKTTKHQGFSWTVWDRGIIKDDPTLRELLNWLSDKGLNAYSISCGSCLLYNSMFPRHKERTYKKLVDLARDMAKVEIPAYC